MIPDRFRQRVITSQLLPWSNTSGTRLLSGTMQVEILPAAPFIYDL
jgi:hypothetical protein